MQQCFMHQFWLTGSYHFCLIYFIFFFCCLQCSTFYLKKGTLLILLIQYGTNIPNLVLRNTGLYYFRSVNDVYVTNECIQHVNMTLIVFYFYFTIIII